MNVSPEIMDSWIKIEESATIRFVSKHFEGFSLTIVVPSAMYVRTSEFGSMVGLCSDCLRDMWGLPDRPEPSQVVVEQGLSIDDENT